MQEEPGHLQLTATMQIEAAAETAGDKPALPRFTMLAYTGGPMKIAGWRFPVVVDLAGLAIPSQSRPVRFGHDAASGVGHTDRIAVETGQLIAAGVISRDTAAAREIVVSARNGFQWQASIGASVEQFEFVKENQTVLVNGREFAGPLNVVRKATLGEISFVDLGADGETSARLAASAKEKEPMDATKTDKQNETVAAAAGGPGAGKETAAAPAGTDAAGTDVAPAKVEAQAAPAAKVETPACSSSPAPLPASDTVASIRAEAAAEEERIAAVRKVCGGDHTEIVAKALREGWDVTRTELEILRASRPKAPAAHVVDQTVNGKVLEAACMLSARL
ncbi:MAG: hypothetical protein NT049_17920, partial [Planctomycetota bacterium]|nr:hypothetical protein [Planctomycetota bacterium]